MRAVFFAILCLAAAAAGADTIEVDPGGDGDFTTIQEAVNAASDGDVIEVAPGIYYENIVFPSPTPGVNLKGVEGAEMTIIDGGGQGKCIMIMDMGEQFGTIRGFTLRNSGSGYERDTYNSGIFINTASTSEWSVEHCIFTGHPNCCITVYNATAPVHNNLFVSEGWGVWVSTNARGFVYECSFDGAEVGVVAEPAARELFVRQCLFMNAISGVSSDIGVPNTTTCNGFWCVPTPYFNCGPGIADIYAEPQICGVAYPPPSDYWLQSDSPLRTGVTGACGTIGWQDVGCGESAAAPSSWSKVKASYSAP